MKVDYNSKELPLKRPFGFWDLESMERMTVQVDGIEFAIIEGQGGVFDGRWILTSEGMGISVYPKDFRYDLEDWGYHIVRHLSNLRRIEIEGGH